MSDLPQNLFLKAPVWAIYARTAPPVIFVMSMNGALAITDAFFLGHYAGAEALTAVTLMFPFFMLTVSFATLVASGMSSILARHLGAGRIDEARAVFAGAHGLALAASAALMALFIAFGRDAATLAAGGPGALADMGMVYLGIIAFCSPLNFILSVQADALRNEGRAGMMAAMSLLVSLANIVFNWVLIAVFELGVAGSAWGTVLAQALALTTILAFRLKGRTSLPLSALTARNAVHAWRRILALGAPQSLNFTGVALISAAVIAALQLHGGEGYDVTVAAYGIVTRVMTFCFLPLLGLSQAMQTVTGNNFGAGLQARVAVSLRFAVIASFLWCAAAQLLMRIFADDMGRAFVSDAAVISALGDILPMMTLLFFISGPLMMIAAHFQAVGDARRAALLSLAKPYLFSLPLIFILGAAAGEAGIWLSSPVAELLLLSLTAAVLLRPRLRAARVLKGGAK